MMLVENGFRQIIHRPVEHEAGGKNFRAGAFICVKVGYDKTKVAMGRNDCTGTSRFHQHHVPHATIANQLMFHQLYQTNGKETTMKHFFGTNRDVLFSAIGLAGLLMLFQGCDRAHDGHDHAAETPESGHVHPPSKYNEVLVEFPGHKYAMEIIDERETTGLVTAFLTDAHFEPTEVDAQEVRLNFVIAGAPKSFTLSRTPQEAGKPATFTLTDMKLATLICEGWQGDATAVVEIGGTPYNSKLVKLSGHDHDH